MRSKTGGRVKGSVNKLTATIRERIELIFNDCINDLKLDELSNREKIELATKEKKREAQWNRLQIPLVAFISLLLCLGIYWLVK